MRRLRLRSSVDPPGLASVGSRLSAALSPAWLALAAICAAGLGLRLIHNDYGLPYVYNVDEGSHFTNRAVEMFGGDPNPGYFQNPSGFTYLVHAALRLRFGHGWPFGDFDGVVRLYRVDPTDIYVVGRSLAAVLGILGVIGVFWVGRRLWGAREGVAAAAVLSFAFLPVVYSRIAVTDVGALLPVALSLYGSVRAYENGRRSDFVLAGAAAGLAIGFKYTSGLVLLPLLIAAAARIWRDRGALADVALAGVAAVVALFVTTPFLFLDFDTAWRQLRYQAELAGDVGKLGQENDNGFVYYLDSLTWGLGWAALAAAVAGAAVELRRDVLRGAILIGFPLALFLYLALQSRYFGRWFLPAYPALALLAASGIGAALRALPRGPVARAAALAVILAAVLAQPIAADVRTGRLLGHTDTRQTARDWLVDHNRRSLRIVIEPAVPGRYYRLEGGSLRTIRRKQFVRGFIRDIRETRIDYGATLDPSVIDRYRRAGFCMVATMSVIRGRAENARDPEALAYYRRLERESRLLASFSPYEPGAGPVPFNFDLSYNYYPTAFERPGPEVKVYRLRGCKQGYGPVPKGTGTPTQ
jgi:Dolichyl-phosphate-mannose-protein mannosyltransferase